MRNLWIPTQYHHLRRTCLRVEACCYPHHRCLHLFPRLSFAGFVGIVILVAEQLLVSSGAPFEQQLSLLGPSCIKWSIPTGVTLGFVLYLKAAAQLGWSLSTGATFGLSGNLHSETPAVSARCMPVRYSHPVGRACCCIVLVFFIVVSIH